MAKQRTEKQPSRPAKASAEADGWPFWARVAVSGLVIWHVFVVFISPFAAFTDPQVSPLLFNIASSPAVRWYSEPMYVAGGYQFFSPDPPLSSMVIRYSITDEVGNQVVQGEFPNRANPNYERQWPRLWYHRHMMLVSQMGEAPVHRNADGQPNFEENRRMSMRSYARHLLRKHGGAVAELQLVQQYSLFTDDAWPARRTDPNRQGEEPLDPSDPRLFETIETVTETADRLNEPLLPASPVTLPESLPLGSPAR